MVNESERVSHAPVSPNVSVGNPTVAVTVEDEGTVPVKEIPQGHFYRVIWRWHFYAGLLVIPIMVMLAVTGIIYLFKPQLDALMYPQHVTPAGAFISLEQQLERVTTAYPAATISQIRPPAAPDRSSEVSLETAEGQNLTVFVNPYTGQVLGARDDDNNLQEWAVTMHGSMMIGTTGDVLIELAACWGLVLVLTGLYLWWPRRANAVLGTLIPRLQTKNKRIFWRDLHAVPGFWGAILIAFMIISGLPWAGFWGDTFAQVWNRYPSNMWDDVPTSEMPAATLNEQVKTVPWAVEITPLPISTLPHTGHDHGSGHEHEHEFEPIGVDAVAAFAAQQHAPPGYTISLPEGIEGVYTISAFPPDPRDQMTIHLDQYSGAVLADIRWKDYSIVPKAVEMGIALHQGTFGGLVNQLVMLAVCLLIILLSVSGGIMWWLRRPKGRLGAPAMPANFPLWRGAVLILLVLAVIFPLVGASLLVALALDYLLVQRVPALQRVLN
jgi:uncharacterized iron-regulated membrane protein